MPKVKPPSAFTQELLQAARQHLAVYMAVVHRTDMPGVADGGAVPARHHREIIDVLMDGGIQRKLIAAPREAAKTTLVQGWIEWRLGRSSLLDGEDWANTFRLAYISDTASQAYRMSNAIAATIEGNAVYKALFPKVKPNEKKWSEPERRMMGNTGLHANLIFLGSGGPALGFHGDVLLDDICNDENMRSDTERKRLLGEPGRRDGWIDTVVMPILAPTSVAAMIGTRWHEHDAIEWAQEQGWRGVYMKALVECPDEGCEGHSYWPERYPDEHWHEMKRRNPIRFTRSYQNEITPYEGIIFQREWFRNRFDYVPAPEEIRHVFATFDTAGTITGRSYTVGLVILLTKDWDYYVLHMVRGKLDYPDLKRVIREVAKRWKVSATVIEAKSTGQPAIQELSQEGMRVIPVLPPGQHGGPAQMDFVEQVTIACEARRVWLPSRDFLHRHNSEDWTETFLGELLSYPEGSNDDIVVALTQLMYYLERDRAKWEFETTVPRSGIGYSRSNERAISV